MLFNKGIGKLIIFLLGISLSIPVLGQKLNTGNPPSSSDKTSTQASDGQTDNIQDYKVVSETKNPDGGITRVVQYKKGNVVVSETTILPPMPKIGYHKPINTDTLKKDSLLVLVDKPNYLVAVIYRRKRIRQYRAVFGPDRLSDKMVEGDRKTPTGWFKIVSKKNDSRWDKFILLDYPNQASYAKFNERKKEGKIPPNARIGNNIGIHGTYPTGVGMVDLSIGWTDGCISLKPKDVEDLYNLVGPGTRVYIR